MQTSDYRNVNTDHTYQHHGSRSYAAASTSDPSSLDTLTRGDVIEAVNYGLASGRNIRTLLQALDKAGCPTGRSFFHVERCEGAVGGGFAPGYGVVLCHNRLHSRREVLAAMNHELVHAYDHCRGGCGGAVLGSTAAVVGGAAGINAADMRDSGVTTGDGGGLTSSGVVRSSSSCSRTTAGTLASSAASISQEGAAAGGGSDVRQTMAGGNGGGVIAAGGRRATAAADAVEVLQGVGEAGRGPGDGSGGEGFSRSGFHEWRCGGGMDWHNCDQHVCSEIRAANLSGDCSVLQELLRGNLPVLPTRWAEQQRACVARRAALSAALNPGCGGREGAEAAVERLLPYCLADTEPLGPEEAVARP